MYPVVKIGGFLVPTYGLIAVSTFLFLYWLIRFYAIREDFHVSQSRDMFFYFAASSLAGSKLFSIMTELPRIMEDPKYLKTILVAGGVFYGGMLSGVLFLTLYSYYQKINFLMILDMFSPLGMLSMAIARWGCFASGCCFGRPTDVPWAVTFTNQIAHRIHPDLPNVPIHPTQIYLSFNALIIFMILNILYRRKKFHGQIFFSSLLFYGIGRFLIEYYRFDYRGVMLGGSFSTSQLIAMITVSLSIVTLFSLARKKSKRSKS